MDMRNSKLYTYVKEYVLCSKGLLNKESAANIGV